MGNGEWKSGTPLFDSLVATRETRTESSPTIRVAGVIFSVLGGLKVA